MLIDRMNIYTIQRAHHLLCYCAGTNGYFFFKQESSFDKFLTMKKLSFTNDGVNGVPVSV